MSGPCAAALRGHGERAVVAAKRPTRGQPEDDRPMLKWALIFAVISIIAGLLGFTGIAAGAAGIAKVLFVVFLVVFLVLVALALLGVGALRK
jgi:uncharacterized membrane protein YtjA (UPF0391 family)